MCLLTRSLLSTGQLSCFDTLLNKFLSLPLQFGAVIYILGGPQLSVGMRVFSAALIPAVLRRRSQRNSCTRIHVTFDRRPEFGYFSYISADLFQYVDLYACINSYLIAGPSGREVYNIGLRPHGSWSWRFESLTCYRCLSVFSDVCCQLEVFATSWNILPDGSLNVFSGGFVLSRNVWVNRPHWPAVP
jgi:hypothetical protein